MYSRLRDLRQDHDLTQKEVGAIVGMSQTGYSQYELGNNDVPTHVLITLSEFYKDVYKRQSPAWRWGLKSSWGS